MTLFEIVCALIVIACTGAASSFAWESAVVGLQGIERWRAIHEVSGETAEKIYAHQNVSESVERDGFSCKVYIAKEVTNHQSVDHVTVQSGQFQEELWLPNGT